MHRSRALLLAFALQATPPGASRFARFCRRKSAYVAALLVRPQDYDVKGFVNTGEGVDVLWQPKAHPALAR